MVLNKEQFNQLDISDQVAYINQHLHDTSLTKVCDSIGIDRATVRKRFKSRGYILTDNQYTLDQTITPTKPRHKMAAKPKQTVTKPPSKTVEDRLAILEQKVKELESRPTSTTNTTSNLKHYTGTEVVRSYRVNEDIQKQFKTFCKSHSEYKVSDILSQALEEFLNNHN